MRNVLPDEGDANYVNLMANTMKRALSVSYESKTSVDDGAI